MKKRCCIFLFLFVFISSSSLSFDLKGLARLEIQNRKINLEMDQAVIISDNLIEIHAIDDFGGTPFKIIFVQDSLQIWTNHKMYAAKGSKLKKILSLPLTQDQFMHILRYELPKGFQKTTQEQTELWQSDRHKKLKIQLSDFTSKLDQVYPRIIEIRDRKNLFKLTWIEFKK
jgi:hypothetical protein